jgi:hypothetical protein
MLTSDTDFVMGEAPDGYRAYARSFTAHVLFRTLQNLLGATPDGVIGPRTMAAWEAFVANAAPVLASGPYAGALAIKTGILEGGTHVSMPNAGAVWDARVLAAQVQLAVAALIAVRPLLSGLQLIARSWAPWAAFPYPVYVR